jgi:glyoxylase-like metal-dependent hydrolase (beta-lactamase superfamily II)
MTRRGLIKELRRSVVKEIAEDVWLLEGYLSDDFFGKPHSSNIYILRDGDSLLILDTGTHAFYRERMHEIIDRYKKEGVKRITLLLTQGHFDHASNNVIVLESGLEWQFLLPEVEFGTINFVEDAFQDIRNLEEYYDVFSCMFPWRGECIAVRLAEKISPNLARMLIRAAFSQLFGGARTLAEQATTLRLEDRKSRRFGSIELQGWEVGRFFAIHDGSHTPGHISLYDPDNKLLLSGDVTVEINPAFFYSSVGRCIEASRNFRRLAEQGYIELTGDSHRSATFFPELFDKYKISPLSEMQLVDVARGGDECVAFFRTFEDYYSQLREEVLRAHERAGTATVGDILEELCASRSPAVQLKRAMLFPEFPSRMDVLVAAVLKEAGVTPRREGKRIVLDPIAQK